MTLAEYHHVVKEKKFDECPSSLSGNTVLVEEILDYHDCDLELKTYMAEMILKRCFPPTYNCLGNDIDWFLNGFRKDFEADLIEPWRTPALKEAMNMIMSENVFAHGVIGTTYMFGAVEFYAKYFLGWRPLQFDFFDNENHEKFRKMYISDAFIKLKKITSPLAASLNRIDKYNIEMLRENCIKEERFIKARIADRLLLARNTMLHGEKHNFYSISHYLLMLYALFHLHKLQQQ